MAVSLHTDFVSKVRSDASSVSRLARQRSLPGSRLLFSESGLLRAARLIAKRPGPAARSSTYADGPVDVTLSTDSALEAANGRKYTGKTAVVVGAGPAGSAAAIHLSRHGFAVKIFEKRKDLRESPMIGTRSYTIALTTASAAHMRNLGVDLPSSRESGFVNGFHVFIGAQRNSYGGSAFDQTEIESYRILGSRQAITEALLNAVERQCAAELHFEHSCTDVSLSEQKISFADGNGYRVEEDYDLLVAADGANSSVREQLLEYDKDISISVSPNRLKHIGVQGLFSPQDDDIYSKAIAPGWVSFVSLKTPNGVNKRDFGNLTLSRLEGGISNLSFSAPLHLFEQIRKEGEDWLYNLMPEKFPTEWTDKLREAVMAHDPVALPSIIHVSKLIGPATVLVGDAAHPISPALGFGCNLALGDGKVLSEALSAADGDIAKALRIFNDMRHEEVNLCQSVEEVGDLTTTTFKRRLLSLRCGAAV